MRKLAAYALLLLISFATPAHPAGVSYTGVSTAVDTDPDYILIIGDPQIGGNCTGIGWAEEIDDADHQACGNAHLEQLEDIIQNAFSSYPIDYAVIEGDLVDLSSRPWQKTLLLEYFATLTPEIANKINVVGGNHDGGTSTCAFWHEYFGTDWGLEGEEAELYWEKKLKHTRLIGFQNSLIGQYDAVPCHAQRDAAKRVAPNGTTYGNAVCYGLDYDLGDDKANGATCAADSECGSGKCGLWEDRYAETMAFIADQFAKFNRNHFEETLIVNSHQALCRTLADGSCSNRDQPVDGTDDEFEQIQNLKVCVGGTDDGKYCNFSNGGAECAGGDSFCTGERPGFETRDTFIAHMENVSSSKGGVVWASGHTGTTPQKTQTVDTNQFASGTPFLLAEAPGVHAVALNGFAPAAMVIIAEHNKSPRIVEYIEAANRAPVLDEIGVAGEMTVPSSGNATLTVTATDPDYGVMSYYIKDVIGTEFDGGCLAIANSSAEASATITATSCTPGDRHPASGEYSLCATDYPDDAGTPTATLGAGIEDCQPFHVQVAGGVVYTADDSLGGYDMDDVQFALDACAAAAPAEGCIIDLLGQEYTDVQFKLPGTVREIRGLGDTSILKGPADPTTGATLGPIILVEEIDFRSAAFTLTFRDFKIDGNKQALTATPVHHNCIRVSYGTALTIDDGVVDNVTCESVTQEGFQIEDAPGWSFTNNELRYLGCWDRTGYNIANDPDIPSDWQPNGIAASLMGCGTWGSSMAWDGAGQDDTEQPGRLTNGIGIEVQRNADDVLIEGNTVEYFTKIGIQGIDVSLTEEEYPKRGTVNDNTVQWGLVGINLARTNDWDVTSNFINDIGASLWQFGNVGQAIACSYGGRDSYIGGNTIARTEGSGISAGCGCGVALDAVDRSCGDPVTGGITVMFNTINDTCGTWATNNAAITLTSHTWETGDAYAENINFFGNTVTNNGCPSTVQVAGYDDVDLDTSGFDNTFSAGTAYGAYIDDASNIIIDADDYTGTGSGTGIYLGVNTSGCTIDGSPAGTWTDAVVDNCRTPTNLQPSELEESVGLTWTDVSPTTTDEFVVQYRCPSGSGSYTEHSRPTSASATVTGLTAGVECDFSVASEDAFDNTSVFTTDVQATPAAVAGGGTVYSFAIIGDTQDATMGGGELTQFSQIVDDITSRSSTENIVAALQVGDAVQNGTFLPLPSECSDDLKTVGWTTCDDYDADAGACDAVDGCTHDGSLCIPCQLTEFVNDEWDRFNAEVLDFAPGQDTTSGVPFAFVRGNHDNLGGETTLDDRGIDPHWQEADWEALESAFDLTSGAFELVHTEDFGVEGTLNVFRVMMGTTPILIFAPPYQGGTAYTTTLVDRVVELADQLGQRWILLAHDTGENPGTLLTSTMNASPVPPGLIAVASGHTGSANRDYLIDSDGSREVAYVEHDMSNANQGDDWAEYVLLDYRPSTDEVRVRLVNPPLATEVTQIDWTTLAWPTDEEIGLYDLSPYATEIAEALGTHTWPVGPTTLPANDVTVTDCATLETALEQGSTHVVVADGTTIGTCGSITIASNTWLEMLGSASITATLSAGTSDHVKVTGGVVNNGSVFTVNGDDFIYRNVRHTRASAGPAFQSDSGNNTQRHAYVNNFISAGTYAILYRGDLIVSGIQHHFDVTIAGNELVGGTTTDEATMRLQDTRRSLVVGNLGSNDFGLKTVYRFYDDTHDMLLMNNVSITSYFAGGWEIASTGDSHSGVIDHVRIIDNRYIWPDANGDHTPFYISTTRDKDGFGSCNDVRIYGNQRVTRNVPAIRHLTSTCSNITIGAPYGSDDTSVDINDVGLPYGGLAPTCATVGDAIEGCGPDH